MIPLSAAIAGIAIMALLSSALVVFAIWALTGSSDRRESITAKMIADLQSDNRALTEALVRVEGKPLVFHKPEPEPSPGWFDGKPRIVKPENPKAS